MPRRTYKNRKFLTHKRELVPQTRTPDSYQQDVHDQYLEHAARTVGPRSRPMVRTMSFIGQSMSAESALAKLDFADLEVKCLATFSGPLDGLTNAELEAILKAHMTAPIEYANKEIKR